MKESLVDAFRHILLGTARLKKERSFCNGDSDFETIKYTISFKVPAMYGNKVDALFVKIRKLLRSSLNGV